ncbi:peptidoglycan-binding protein [Spirulina sp. CS-785/01]|uniref:peptidoglycan-binding domain-containing protein n=1 Tax=Spirulina sp. CS-785/01 TaxID=3021716 RepID=UPI0023312150|nr:peptidoglycan-binding protein [Spirulina sp. CS-785/01]MDB9314801.1 peptidoglycan-binding protein [Spirulina sp. CS-785/01]
MLKQHLWSLFFPLTVSILLTAFPSPQQGAQAQPQPNRPTLRMGSQGEAVQELQAALKLLGFYTDEVTGLYTESTIIAVSRFQEAANLPVNGIVEPTTWAKLFPTEVASEPVSPPETSETLVTEQPEDPPPTSSEEETPETTETSPEDPPEDPEPNYIPVLRLGMEGRSVRRLQTRLQELGILSGTVDGIFGEKTLEAVREFQRRSNLTVDGVVGPATWDALSP